MNNFIEITNRATGKRVSINLSQINSFEALGAGCQIMEATAGGLMTISTVETYAEVKELVRKAYGESETDK